MKTNTVLKVLVGAIIVLLLIGVAFCTGYKTYPKLKPCPELDTTTIVTVDPYWHTLADSLAGVLANTPKEVIKWKPIKVKVKDWAWIDSVMKANEAKPNDVIQDFYSVKTYEWEKLDTGLLYAHLLTTVTQNKPISYKLDYKILKPLTATYVTQDNSIFYSKYLYAGITVPVCFPKVVSNLDLTTVDLIYAFPKGYLGTGYQGLFNNSGHNYLLIKGGIRLLKFKEKK